MESIAQLLPQLNDVDLATLAYLIGQAEGRQEDNGCYLNGKPGLMALEINRAAGQREKARRVTLSNPVTGSRSVTLKAGPA